jgi:tRNA(Ile)-lysidine synthetase-like protein
MQPFGMQRHKLLSDLLVDAKIPLDQKKEIPVIEDANGRILWVVGLRLSECLRWKEGDAGVVLLGERK